MLQNPGCPYVGTGSWLHPKSRLWFLLWGTGLSLSGNRFPAAQNPYFSVFTRGNRFVPHGNRFLRTCTAKFIILTAFTLSHFPNSRYIRTYTQLSLIFTQLHIPNKLLTCISIIFHK